MGVEINAAFVLQKSNRAIEEKSGLLKNVEIVEKLKIAPLVYSKKCLCYLENIKIIYDNRAIVENVSFSINRHERINLVGKNGSGKSSIIKLIMGGNIEYEGKINIGSNLKIAYLSQDDSNLSGSLDDYARNNDLDLSLFKTILRKIDFSRELFLQDISTYSKGQKKCLFKAKPQGLYLYEVFYDKN
mgnify:CR=1 FL=1